MPARLRRPRTLHLPITLSVTLIVLNIALMVVWIVLFAQNTWWLALTVGVVAFAVILAGLSVYMILMIKEVRLNQRQANFIDAVTHELKSPIASLRLYLETLTLRTTTEENRQRFYGTMERELERLDHLISQLLEVGRLDAIGAQSDPMEIALDSLLRSCAQDVCAHHRCDFANTFRFDMQAATVHARPLVVETIFRNLLDNAVKYGAEPPHVEVSVRQKDRSRIVVRISDDGQGILPEDRKRIFQIFYRAGNELQRRRKGTGLGLYIVQTLVRQLKGRVSVHDRADGPGSVFEVELPGHAH